MGSKRVSYVPESVRLVQERAKEHTVKVYRGKDGGPIVLGANAAKRARREAEREARRQDLLWREEQRLMVKRGERRARKIASEPREPMTSKGAVMREGLCVSLREVVAALADHELAMRPLSGPR